MAERMMHELPSSTSGPLIGVVDPRHGSDAVIYFAHEDAADAALGQDAVSAARALAGAWRDLPWSEVVAELDRIDREAPPSAPIAL